MAKKFRRSKGRHPWRRRRWYFVPIAVGLLALAVNVKFFGGADPWVQNLFNWVVGVGLVGGAMSFFVDWLSTGRYRM